MAYDVCHPKLGAFDAADTHALSGHDGPRLAVEQHDWRDFDRREKITQWDDLAQRASEPNPFYESWQLLPALRALDEDNSVQLLALEVEGDLVGLLPMHEESHYYGRRIPHFRNWVHHNCFLGMPLIERGFERPFWRAVLDHCNQHTGSALFLHLAQMPATGAVHDALVDELQARGTAAATVLLEQRAMLSGIADAQAYFEAALSTKRRKELRRQHRRLSEQGEVTIERLDTYSDVAKWTREFLELEARGWKGEAGSALACDKRTRDIFTHTIAGAAARKRLERLALRLDGRPIAMLATFLTAPGAYSYKTTFDEDFASFSPGVLLQQENLAMLERADIQWVDSCAAEDHPMIDHIWHNRRAIAHHSIGIGGPLRRGLFSLLSRIETGKPARGIV